MKSNIKTEKIEIEKLKPYENNAKVHTEEQILALMQSIQELGYNDPIQVNEENMILAGHGRYEALKRLGVTGKILVTRIVGLTDIEQKAYMLAHNKLTLKTGFDFDRLKEEIEKIVNEEVLTLTGFTEIEIKDLEVSMIDELEANGMSKFFEDYENEEKKFFSITFNFPHEYEEKIKKIIKEKTKEYFVELIMKEIERG